jgi:hypothetical protein
VQLTRIIREARKFEDGDLIRIKALSADYDYWHHSVLRLANCGFG